jgi:hypothetical protein
MIQVEDIQELHREAMDLAEMASVAKLKGDPENAENLLREAYKKESDSAKMLVDDYDFEPTRSILFRSAASLAMECNDFRGAERLIAFGLSGNPPEEIADELRDLLDKLNIRRHLENDKKASSKTKRELFIGEWLFGSGNYYATTISDKRNGVVVGVGKDPKQSTERAYKAWKKKAKKTE